MAVLYFAGWIFENTDYWLDERAMSIWVGALPLWLVVWGGIWRSRRRVIPIGFAISGAIFLMHVMIMKAIRGHLWDDHYGIAAIVAVTSLLGWILGRMIHGAVRWNKIQPR